MTGEVDLCGKKAFAIFVYLFLSLLFSRTFVIGSPPSSSGSDRSEMFRRGFEVPVRPGSPAEQAKRSFNGDRRRAPF